MALSGLTKHRKFIRLKRLIGSTALALGSLELIWHTCYETCDDFLGNAADIEGVAEWEGPEGKLVEALLTSGFIDKDPSRPGNYLVHDLYEHAPNYVKKRIKRDAERMAAGLTISDIRRDAANKRWPKDGDANGGQDAADASQADANGSQNDTNGLKNMQTDANGFRLHANGCLPNPTQPNPTVQKTTASAYADARRRQAADTPPGSKDFGQEIQEVVKTWNATCGAAGLPIVQKLYDKRRAAIKARLAESGWLEDFKTACGYIAKHPDAGFYRGEKGWKASLDYLLRPGNVQKTVERSLAPPNSRASPARASPGMNRTAKADQALSEDIAKIDWDAMTLEAANG